MLLLFFFFVNKSIHSCSVVAAHLVAALSNVAQYACL